MKKDPVYDERINDLKNVIYGAIKIHPSFQHFSEDAHYVLYNIERGEPVTLYEYCKIWFKTEYGFSFSTDSKQRDTIYTLKNKIAEKYGIPLEHQDWVCKDIKLDNNYLTIYDYDQKNKGLYIYKRKARNKFIYSGWKW